MNAEDRSSRGSFAGRLLERLFPNATNEPETKDQLIEVLHAAKNRALFDTEALSMIEGVMQVSEMQVRDIMIPRASMDVVQTGFSQSTGLP